ncbi:hypothetical protein HMPREF9711_00898 [Myroides odoratimimus CCUG 3837]|nr:hypothetical protein HMPREF9711_00898 [Myroides odoratimimus CCUG 3837]
MQKISTIIDNYLENDRAEPDSYPGVQTFIGITENNLMEVRLERNSKLYRKLRTAMVRIRMPGGVRGRLKK